MYSCAVKHGSIRWASCCVRNCESWLAAITEAAAPRKLAEVRAQVRFQPEQPFDAPPESGLLMASGLVSSENLIERIIRLTQSSVLAACRVAELLPRFGVWP